MPQTKTFDGAPGGSNLSLPPHEIGDGFARYIRDAFLDVPGIIARRGRVEAYAGVVTSTSNGWGLLQAVSPSGVHRVGLIRENLGGLDLFALSDTLAAMTKITQTSLIASFTISPLYDSKAAINGGVLLGYSTRFDSQQPSQGLFLWGGANKASLTGTTSLTISRGSKSAVCTGQTFLTTAEAGMYLFAMLGDDSETNVFVGEVAAVVNDTTLTLKDASPIACTNRSWELHSTRTLRPRYATGRISCSTTSTTVTGSGTRFADHGLGASSGQWRLYRRRDMTFIGKVASASATSPQTSLTLSANAAVAMDLEEYVAIFTDNASLANGTFDNTAGASSWALGWITAAFAGRQWYFNASRSPAHTYRGYYSEPNDLEAVDQTSYVEITGGKPASAASPVVAAQPTAASLLLLKEAEAFALTGNTPTQFRADKVGDDGTLSTMSVQPYQGGAIYAGKEGIYFFDGIETRNIVEDRLGPFYKKAVSEFDPTTQRMYATILKDHYILHITQAIHDYTPIKNGAGESLVDNMVVVVYLPSRAVSFFRNVEFVGAITPPANSGRQPMFLVNTALGLRICDGSSLFDTTGADTVTCVGAAAGPDFYLESKRYSLGDSMWKKLYKQLKLTFLLSGANLKLETVIGLNETGTVSVSEYQAAQSLGTWITKRIKFLRRGNHLGFRLYQASASVTDVKIGPWQIGFKPQSPGRV